MKTFTSDQPEPERLDKLATTELGITRSQVQKLIKAEKILVDDKPANARTMIDSSMVMSYDPTILDAVEKVGEMPVFEILFENEEMVTINKPAGVLVHEAETSTEFTLVDALLCKWPEIATVGDDAKRAGLVHRLDKHASGIMVVAKTQEAFDHLKTQFKDRLVKKNYTVLVHEKLSQESGTIDFPISRSKTSGRMAARSKVDDGKKAVTHYDTIKAYPHHTLLDVNIETGRTHQIRVHFFAMDHPVVGDTLYRQRGVKPMDIGRLFLHARKLRITIPNGEEKTFEAPIPKELEDVLDTIPKL
ncbi:RluA family pseudouridine synthase [Candidatus Uhrbacteria bacterium]|nr:RluA family pseudouridine synthase [Candidatus Uhrbacteria bacterium]